VFVVVVVFVFVVVEGANPWESLSEEEEAGESGREEFGVCGEEGEGERVDAAEGEEKRCEREECVSDASCDTS